MSGTDDVIPLLAYVAPSCSLLLYPQSPFAVCSELRGALTCASQVDLKTLINCLHISALPRFFFRFLLQNGVSTNSYSNLKLPVKAGYIFLYQTSFSVKTNCGKYLQCASRNFQENFVCLSDVEKNCKTSNCKRHFFDRLRLFIILLLL